LATADDGTTHYDVLAITSDFPTEAIGALRASLAKLYHPDGGSEPDPVRMSRINAACDVLGDPGRRELYDRGLIRRRPVRPRSTEGAGPAEAGGPARAAGARGRTRSRGPAHTGPMPRTRSAIRRGPGLWLARAPRPVRAASWLVGAAMSLMLGILALAVIGIEVLAILSEGHLVTP
jgi:hypothetical protein